MAWKTVGEVDITVTQGGTEQDSFTTSDATTVELFDYITNHGSQSIDGPNDTLNGAGYYSEINNNIADQGDIDNLALGEHGNTGYYTGGSVDGPNTYIDVNGSRELTNYNQNSNTVYDLSVSLGQSTSVLNTFSSNDDFYELNYGSEKFGQPCDEVYIELTGNADGSGSDTFVDMVVNYKSNNHDYWISAKNGGNKSQNSGTSWRLVGPFNPGENSNYAIQSSAFELNGVYAEFRSYDYSISVDGVSY